MNKRRILSCFISLCLAYAPMSCYALEEKINPPEAEIGRESLMPVSDYGENAERYAFENACKCLSDRHGVSGIVPLSGNGMVFSYESGFFSPKRKTYTQADCFLSCISRHAP